jgi:hypothetical protein
MSRILVGLTSLVVLLVLIGYAATGAPPDLSSSDLSLTASPVREPNGSWRLQFELAYSGEKPLAVSERSLPWKSHRDLLLVAIPLDAARSPLAAPDPPSPDSPSITLTLDPGDSLSGGVNVSSRFPDLAAAVQKSDVMVFWSHQLRAVDSATLPRLTGGVLLPRQR